MKSITLKLFVLTVLFISPACSKPNQSTKPSDVDYYTCTMHPSAHAEAPGKCPICGMDLVPVMKKTASPSASEASSGGGLQGMAGMPGMQSGELTSGALSHEFVVPVERQQQIGVSYATVKRAPLHHTIRAVGTVEPDLQKHWAFVARVDGYVKELFVPSAGQLVEKNAPLMSIYSPDLFTTERELLMLVRMRAEAKSKDARAIPERLISAAFYESELSMLKTGQAVTVTSSSYPNEKFEGQVAVISPFLDQTKRTAKVRIDIPNPDFKLQPGMYANVELGMDMGEGLVVPASAVMPTGSREIAFVDKGGGRLESRLVKLGQQIGDHYEVKSGLAEGERVIASANFLIDAESKVQGALADFAAAPLEHRHQ